jgi:hypothetical protein
VKKARTKNNVHTAVVLFLFKYSLNRKKAIFSTLCRQFTQDLCHHQALCKLYFLYSTQDLNYMYYEGTASALLYFPTALLLLVYDTMSFKKIKFHFLLTEVALIKNASLLVTSTECIQYNIAGISF